MNNKRGDSGKASRYQQATEKYKLFQQKKDRINQMDSILTGKKTEAIIPKPGEFFVASSDLAPTMNRKLIDRAIRDSSAGSSPVSIQPRSTLQASTQQHQFVQGSLSKQVSLPNFKQNFNRISHDFPSNVHNNDRQMTDRNIVDDEVIGGHQGQQLEAAKSQVQFDVEPSYTVGGRQSATMDQESNLEANIKLKQKQILSNPQFKTTLTTNIRNIMRNQDKALLTTSNRLLNAQVKKQVLKSDLKSLVAESRRSMSPQDEGSPVPEIARSMGKSMSTLQLLKKERQTIQMGEQNVHKSLKAPNTQIPPLNPSASLPQFKTLKAMNSQENGSEMQAENLMMSHRDPFTKNLGQQISQQQAGQRPQSTIVMQLGEKNTKRLVKKKFDLQNARLRDANQTQSHTYKSKLAAPGLSSLQKSNQMGTIDTQITGKSTTLGINAKLPVTPVLVQYQNALIRENKNISPFMVTNTVTDQSMLTIDGTIAQNMAKPPLSQNPKRLNVSQSTKQFLNNPLSGQEGGGQQERLKYTDSTQTLKKLRESDNLNQKRPDSSMFKKGSSEFIKRKLLSSASSTGFDTNDFQKALEKRFGTQVIGDNEDRTFLPIEAFDPLLDIEIPTEVILKYQDEATGQTLAQTRWNYPNGEAELRPCIVEQFLPKKDLYEVHWVHNPQSKKRVSRFNLIFDREDKAEYERRIEMAHKYRQEAEILMRYHYLIDKVQLPKSRESAAGQTIQIQQPQLVDQTKTRISYLISSFDSYGGHIEGRQVKDILAWLDCQSMRADPPAYEDPENRYANVKFIQRWRDFDSMEPDILVQRIHSDMKKRKFNLRLLSDLFKELDFEFTRTHKQIFLDVQLPFDKEKCKLFKDVLPKEKFIPIVDRKADLVNPPALVDIPERANNFEKKLKQIMSILHRADEKRLRILQMAQTYKIRNLERRLLIFEYQHPIDLKEFKRSQDHARDLFLKYIDDSKFDCEYEVGRLINDKAKQIEEKNAENMKRMTHNQDQYVKIEMSEEFIQSMRNFQRVLHMTFEDTMRQVFMSTIDQSVEQLRFALKQVEESVGVNLLVIPENEESDQNGADRAQKYAQLTDEIILEKEHVLTLCRDSPLQTRIKQNSCFQLDMTLEFDKNSQKIGLTPGPEDWINELPHQLETSLQNLSNIKGFLHDKLGTIHQNGDHQIFKDGDDYPERSISHVTYLLNRLFQVPRALTKEAQNFNWILAEDLKDFKRRNREEDITVEAYQKMLRDNKQAREDINELLYEETLLMGAFVVRVGDLKKRLYKKISQFDEILIEQIKRRVDQATKQIVDEVDTVLAIVLNEDFKNIEEVDKTKIFMKNLPDKMHEIRMLIKGVNAKIAVLDENFVKRSDDEFEKTWNSFARPLDIFIEQGDCFERLEKLTEDFKVDLKEMQVKLEVDISEISNQFDEVILFEELSQHLQAGKMCEALEDKIFKTLDEATVCNRREKLFGYPTTDYKNIEDVMKKFRPYNRLWGLATQYYTKIGHWMEGEIGELDGDQLPREIDDALQELRRLKNRDFKDVQFTGRIAQELRDLYSNLKPFMPILSSLKNPDVRIVHFEIIKKDHGLQIEHDLRQSLQQLKELGVMEIVDEIIEISGIATKERQLESQLNKMNDEWKVVRFELQEFRDSGCVVLQGVQIVWDLLDEHIQKTMIIASSPYAKFFLSEALYWKQRLVKVQEILEEWSRAQRGWCYLWPIFNSPDIQQQLPEVHTMFMTMDKMWRMIMEQTQANNLVLDACGQSRAFENLQYCNETIDKVTKSLNEYLHSKQLLFPRFFFLSNDDLLHILSQTKDPVRVQDHLNKCFEGIEKLQFEPRNLEVSRMFSSMGEQVMFSKPVQPFEVKVNEKKEKVKGVRAIEDWLLEVETQMRDSIRQNVLDSYVEFSKVPKKEWLFKWPQQVVLVIDQIMWTEKMERAIETQEQTSLKMAYESEESKLQELVELIKTPNLRKKDIQTLESMIVLDVHSKDLTYDIMQQNIKDISVFEWISQLRHYTAREQHHRTKVEQLEIKIGMINSTRYYGFEYQGNQTRLIITPLTDRCYRTLMGALQLNLGGAPEGPAGTGKTETTKDLAKALAKQCLVFNCSDQLDVQTMAKFFKGLACCGAWACFDEFNRIDLEVLSVIAQQILQIQNALMRKKPSAMFNFEEESILLNAQCAVFITMNPTYAGRSQLPDNLKALFRPVAMMIPNYELIAEIQLYAYGFQKARELSVKIVQSLKLSSEQLSTQSHYDYGMRAVKSIILAAGVLKRRFGDSEESNIVLRAISDCNIPKFINDDINLFKGIISDLFPTTDKSKPTYPELKEAIEATMLENNLTRNEEFETKTIQLYETVQVRHGLMLVGAPMGGKSAISKTLAEALTRIERHNYLEESKSASNSKDVSSTRNAPQVKIHSINPKSVSIGRLYGDFEKVSRDWQDGILAKTVRDTAADKSADTHWIMLDGPVDTLWIENLNTVLDDNKKLCLISSEIIKLTPRMTMMFEVEDLLEASPATVSRCGMVFVSPEKLGWQPLINPWITSLPASFKELGMEKLFLDLMGAFLPRIIEFLFGREHSAEEDARLQGLKPVLKVSPNQQVRSFLNLFEGLLFDKDTKEVFLEREDEAKVKKEAHMKRQTSKNAIASGRTNYTEDDEDGGLTSRNKTLRQQKTQNVQKYFDVIEPKRINWLIQQFIMALIWGFGASLTASARPQYSQHIHLLLDELIYDKSCDFEFKKRIDPMAFPKPNCNLFSVFFHPQDLMWHKWDYEIHKYDIRGDKAIEEEQKKRDESKMTEDCDKSEMDETPIMDKEVVEMDEDIATDKVEFHNIFVANEDSIQNLFIMECLVSHGFPVLLVGETGTGKTRITKKLVGKLAAKEALMGKFGFEAGEIVLSATATAQQIQGFAESKLEKHRQGVLGPKNPTNHIIFFIDDLNMPVKEKFGAQPSLEMLRQIIDAGGFYSLKHLELQRVIRQIFVCAMGTPGGGRTLPSARLLRHFTLLNVVDLSKDQMTRIYKQILQWGFKEYSDVWQKQIVNITQYSIEIYQKAVQNLLPLPKKSHYLFNLRQVSEIIQGLFQVPAEIVEKSQDKLGLLKRLWIHEVQRVFSDRLINASDKEIFAEKCLRFEDTHFWKPTDFEGAQNYIFCNFVDMQQSEPTYQESKSMASLKESAQKVLDGYNQNRAGGKQKMNILLFDYMLQHLSRVSRILAKPFGNGLLVGLGGNGRKSISKLASYVNECGMFKIEPHKNYGGMEWLDDMRNLYKTLGIDNKKIVFEFTDDDIKEELFIEDINNILNVGELTSLFNDEDEEEIHYEIEKQLKKHKVKNITQETTRDVFSKRCKRNLHLLLFMSPAGNQLQNYFKKYPSLVNCTSIDWFLNWPTEALQAVSNHFLLKLHGLIYNSTQVITPYDSNNVSRDNLAKNEQSQNQNQSSELEARKGSTVQRQLEVIAENEENDTISQGNLGGTSTGRSPIKGVDVEKTKQVAETPAQKPEQDQSVVLAPVTETPNPELKAGMNFNGEDQALSSDNQGNEEEQAIEAMTFRQRVGDVFTQIHQSVMWLGEQYETEKKKNIYVTPIMFTSMFKLFEKVLARKNEEIEQERSKYEQGVNKLDEAKIMIEQMQIQLDNLRPILEKKTKQVDRTMKQVDRESKEVQQIAEVVDIETEAAMEEKKVAEDIQQDCQRRLAVAEPFFKKAIDALKTLQMSDFVVMKSFAHPPYGVKLALEACCIMLEIPPKIVKVDGKKEKDYWDKSKKLIKDYKKLLHQLETYPKESIKNETIQKIQPYLENPSFDPALIAQASNAAEGICKWVIAICKFDTIYKEITPKREALAQAEEKFRVSQEALDIKNKQLNELRERQAKLQHEYQQQIEEKQSLIERRDTALKKLNRASALMSSIGSEKDRWIATKQKLAEDKLSLLGDIILATGFVNYLGPFDGVYRLKILEENWTKLVDKYKIRHSSEFSLKEIIGNSEQIAEWTLRGLPNENVSFENMIIIEETKKEKYPIMVDPEGQAFQYFKQSFAIDSAADQQRNVTPRNMIVKATKPSMVKQLQKAIQFGMTVILENCGEVTNPVLLSVIRRELSTVQGGLYIKFNDNTIEFDTDFQIYMFTNLSNPHLSPEVQQLCKMLNFSVTTEGLEQQLLQLICRSELAKEEEDRERYQKQHVMLTRQKKEIFDQILTQLRNSGQEILDSDDFVLTLNSSKEKNQDIEKKLKQAKNNEEKIKEFRERFKNTAKQGARLYFAVQDLKVLDPMYHFSMSWFRGLFQISFKNDVEDEMPTDRTQAAVTDNKDQNASQIDELTPARIDEKTGQTKTRRLPRGNADISKQERLRLMEKRGKELTKKFREILYRNVCMSLFETHKLLFAFFISLKVLEKDKTFEQGLSRLRRLPDKMNSGGPNTIKNVDKSDVDKSRVDNTSSKLSGDHSSSHNATNPKGSVPGNSQQPSTHNTQAALSIPKKSVRGRPNIAMSRNHDISDAGTVMNEQQIQEAKEETRKLEIDENLLKFVLTGLLVQDEDPYDQIDNKRPDLFPEHMWQELHQLTSFSIFEGLLESIDSDAQKWEEFMLSTKAEEAFELLPEPMYSTLTYFAWIPLIRVMKPEFTTMAIRRYIQKALGNYFVSPIIFHLREAYDLSRVGTPLMLILTPGNDPMDQIRKLSEEKQKLVTPVSLGKGQGEKAKELINNSKRSPVWIVLQNCHLSKSFLPELEQIIENLQPQQTGAQNSASSYAEDDEKQQSANPEFRLWLTAMSSDYFPQMILQNSLKITSEPPKSIKSAMLRAYTSVVTNKKELAYYNEHTKPEIWQRLYLSLTFFHAIVRERKRFGPLGWTFMYDFNDSDFRISLRQLYNMVQEFDQVPFKALQYLTGECNYGGRVTDDRDRRALTTILRDFYNPQVLQQETYYIAGEQQSRYTIHSCETARQYLDYIKQLPDEESPQLMGLHENAIIQQAISEANSIFQSVLKLSSNLGSSKEGGPDRQIMQMTFQIMNSIRMPFKIKEVEKKFPFMYEESMNSVLLQELARYNTLIEEIRESIVILQKTLEGKLVSNADSEALLLSLKMNTIPPRWMKKSYPSTKTLIGYVDDLKTRLKMFEDWISNGKPACFWISGFFFTQSFLTGVKQNYARKHLYPIDKIDFDFMVLKEAQSEKAMSEAPAHGCHIHGLFLEGAAWNDLEGILKESEPKIIHTSMPVIQFIPIYKSAEMAAQNNNNDSAYMSRESKLTTPLGHNNNQDNSMNTSSMSLSQQPKRQYECPMYKTGERAGTLLTTGHNTNYIQMITLPTQKDPSLWVRRGVALLCQLDN